MISNRTFLSSRSIGTDAANHIRADEIWDPSVLLAWLTAPPRLGVVIKEGRLPRFSTLLKWQNTGKGEYLEYLGPARIHKRSRLKKNLYFEIQDFIDKFMACPRA